MCIQLTFQNQNQLSVFYDCFQIPLKKRGKKTIISEEWKVASTANVTQMDIHFPYFTIYPPWQFNLKKKKHTKEFQSSKDERNDTETT